MIQRAFRPGWAALLLMLFTLLSPPRAGAQTPQVACQDGVCFRFPGEALEYFNAIPSPLGGPYHLDNGCEKVDGPCYCVTFWGADAPHCYGGHRGTDYMLVDGFRTMRKDVEVVAPADGEVIAYVDDNFDRCHLAIRDLLFDPSHDGNYCGWEYDADTGTFEERDIVNNFIIMRHWNGRYYVYSRILHIQEGSVPGWIKEALAEGRTPRVECGEQIALVGSAGKSYAPHLHFEVRTWGAGDIYGTFWLEGLAPPSLDPYCGPYADGDRSGTYWTELTDAPPTARVPYGLPGTTCQAPYDPWIFTQLPQRCLQSGTGR